MPVHALGLGLPDPSAAAFVRDRVPVREGFAEWLVGVEAIASSQPPGGSDAQGRIAPAVLEGLFGAGLFSLTTPAEYGGMGAGAHEFGRAIAAITRVDPALTFTAGPHLGNGVRAISLFGTEAQKREVLPGISEARRLVAFALTESHTGSDVASHATRLESAGAGKYRLVGAKRWITNVLHAGHVVVCAKCPGLSPNPDGAVFVLIKPEDRGFEVTKVWSKLGLKGSNTVDFRLDGAEVDQDRIVGAMGRGMEQHYRLAAFSRLGIIWAALGAVRRVRDIALLAGRRTWAEGLEGEADALEALAEFTASAAAAGAPDAEDAIVLAKNIATDRAAELAAELFLDLRHDGPARYGDAERLLRDIPMLRVAEGPNEILEYRSALNLVSAVPRFRGVREADTGWIHPELAGFAGRLSRLLRSHAERIRVLLSGGGALGRHPSELGRIARAARDAYACQAALAFASRQLRSDPAWDIRRARRLGDLVFCRAELGHGEPGAADTVMMGKEEHGIA